MYNSNYYSWGPEGWRCPVCGRVYSPTTPMCFYCSNQEVTYGTGTSINDRKWWDDYLKETTGSRSNLDVNCVIAKTDSNVKTTSWNSTITCEQKCEDCDKYKKSCFDGIETTSTKAIISHRRPPEIIFRDGIWWEKYKEE